MEEKGEEGQICSLLELGHLSSPALNIGVPGSQTFELPATCNNKNNK